MSYPISRLPWFERKAETDLNNWNVGATGPHAETKRLSYVCPEGRMAFVEHLIAETVRASAAGTAATCGCRWDYLFPPLEYTILWAGFINNTVDYERARMLPIPLTLFEGEGITAYSLDLSDTGTVTYLLAYKVTEFDVIGAIDRDLIIEAPKPDIQVPVKQWWWPF